MHNLKIALLQMESCGIDQQANLEKGSLFCHQAHEQGADIALFPEMWNCGYAAFDERLLDSGFEPDNLQPPYDHLLKDWQAQAIPTDGPYVNHFRALAQKLNMAIGLTYLQAWPSKPRNVMSLIDRQGEIVYTYAKVHTCDFSMECGCTAGDEFYVATLDTQHGPIQIGTMICYDREFPESARVLMLKGAEIILTPNACDLEINRLSQYRSRAYENIVGLALANYAGKSMGHSIAFDGIAFNQAGSRDMLIVEAGEAEGIFMANFNLDALRAYRADESWGDKYRKPHTYQNLVQTKTVS